MEVGGRRRGRGQRLLYWFRTPPGVRVGRAPIDEEAIRLLEQHNPDVQFDWPRLLKEPPPEPAARRDRDPRERDRRERRDQRPSRPRTMETSGAAVPPMPTPEAAEEMQALAEAADLRATEHAESFAADSGQPTQFQAAENADYAEATESQAAESGATAEGPQLLAAEAADNAEGAYSPAENGGDYADTRRSQAEDNADTDRANSLTAESADIGDTTQSPAAANASADASQLLAADNANRADSTPSTELTFDPVEPLERSEPSEPSEPLEPLERREAREPYETLERLEPLEPPASTRLGPEGLARLRARYADLVSRLADKPMEESVKAELNTQIERLNPDAWRTADEVAAALEEYEVVFERVRSVVGRHPQRHRRV